MIITKFKEDEVVPRQCKQTMTQWGGKMQLQQLLQQLDQWKMLCDKSRIKCFNCNKFGHYVSECRFTTKKIEVKINFAEEIAEKR